MYNLFPVLSQLSTYRLTYLTNDITAAIIVTLLLLPQSMAYALVAGVPISMGLIAATIPLVIYAIFGGSRYLTVGPVSVVSLLSLTGLSTLAQPSSSEYLMLIIVLAFLVGVIQLVMGIGRVGTILKYISSSVTYGFTSALAIIIMLNQIPSILGVKLPKYQGFFRYVEEVVTHLSMTNMVTFAIGIGSIFILFLFQKKMDVKIGPLFVIILSVLIVDNFDLEKRGTEIVGFIPRDIFGTTFQFPTLDIVWSLLPIAITISFISFFESYSVAKTLADKERESINPNQELVGIGFANIASSFVGSIPVGGAVSRAAVSYESGAKSNLSIIITALFMLLAILYVTPMLYFLPKATLGAIIIIAVKNLINFHPLRMKHGISEAILYVVTFATTLLVDVFLGIIVGVFISLGLNVLSRLK
ncbi:SulP family inorganic anion transporter [Ornithinibacillus sp. 179-J 7C1 HS]|uniref:SulP family inorganic anion transporter n=1 Tax=Ornithinibacillus sp. 179-J 7C1 HS TaxID=3142384 RepID=UPI0039A159DB